MLYLAARAANVHSVIMPALEAGKLVVCERFSDATVAYQVWGRGLPEAAVREANDLATGGLVPDLTVLLDLDPEEGFLRLDRQQRALDRIEAEMLDFHRRVRRGYLDLAKQEPRFYTIDASLPENQQDRLVFEQVNRLLMDNEGGKEG
jgi:dTMP kinase